MACRNQRLASTRACRDHDSAMRVRSAFQRSDVARAVRVEVDIARSAGAGYAALRFMGLWQFSEGYFGCTDIDLVKWGWGNSVGDWSGCGMAQNCSRARTEQAGGPWAGVCGRSSGGLWSGTSVRRAVYRQRSSGVDSVAFVLGLFCGCGVDCGGAEHRGECADTMVGAAGRMHDLDIRAYHPFAECDCQA